MCLSLCTCFTNSQATGFERITKGFGNIAYLRFIEVAELIMEGGDGGTSPRFLNVDQSGILVWFPLKIQTIDSTGGCLHNNV